MKRIALLLLLIIVATPSVGYAKGTPNGFADLAEKLSPAVVNISTSKTVKGLQFGGNLFQGLPEGHPFEKFNKFFDQFGGGDKDNDSDGKKNGRKTQSLGSGFVIDAEGYVVTNNHVIDGAEEIEVIFSDDTKYEAKLIGRDKKTDLALLKIESDKPLPYVEFGDSDKSRVGDWVLAIGNPFGLGGSVSAGIISARSRDINSGPFDDFIQTDAAINRGNSGGPMFNMDGKVIGINTAIYSPAGGGNVGIGFSVPTSLAKPIIEQLKNTGTIKRGWLGVKIQTITDDIAESLEIEKHGALVAEVVEDSPADKAGIEVGDIIMKFNGKNVTQMKKLPRIVAETKVGKRVDVMILRDGDEKRLYVQVDRLNEDDDRDVEEGQAEDDEPEEDKSEELLGMKLLELNKKLRKSYNIEKDINGILVSRVLRRKIAEERGISEGDVILKVNKKKAESIEVLRRQIEKARGRNRKSVLLLISRAGETLFLAVPVGKE